MSEILTLYKSLLRKHGPQKWWPVRHEFDPRQFEVCVSAILTQNTNWRNVEKALENLNNARVNSAPRIVKTRMTRLQQLVRPSGFYRQKSSRLKDFSLFMLEFSGNFYRKVGREELLQLKGIGRETADSMLLYACNKPYFVVDAYTRRLLSRLSIIDGSEDYDEIRALFEKSLPRETRLYKEFHALIVRNEKAISKSHRATAPAR